jgi:hypothetical protein
MHPVELGEYESREGTTSMRNPEGMSISDKRVC